MNYEYLSLLFISSLVCFNLLLKIRKINNSLRIIESIFKEQNETNENVLSTLKLLKDRS